MLLESSNLSIHKIVISKISKITADTNWVLSKMYYDSTMIEIQFKKDV